MRHKPPLHGARPRMIAHGWRTARSCGVWAALLVLGGCATAPTHPPKCEGAYSPINAPIPRGAAS